MAEDQPRGMEKRTLEPLYRAHIVGDVAVDTAICRGSYDGVPDRAEVHAALVRPSCGNCHAQQRHALEVLGLHDAGDRVARATSTRRHLLPIRWIASDRRIDPPTGLDEAPDE